MDKREEFSSRWALLMAAIAMAIGAGNIWRFPRLAGQYGGSFLIPWLIFLFMWSIPLLIVEFSLGRKSRQGVLGSFYQLIGPRYTWMGGFVAFCTIAIMFYYSVVTGWAFRYFLVSVSGQLSGVDHQAYWSNFISGYQPIVFHLLALGTGSFIIYQGIVRGLEKANRILLPSLLILLIIGVVRALTLPGASVGLNYFFNIRMEYLLDYKVWLEGLSQSAWSTGAGWGLILTYAVYMKKNEDIVLNSFITGFGNNSASLLAGLAIIPAIFSLSPTLAEAEAALRAGNDGLSFIVIPQLFNRLPGSAFFSGVFFLGLFFAALSSLISMLELATRILMDFGLGRKKALPVVTSAAALLGIPSALSYKFFQNQDWVWGLGLIVSGLFFAIAVISFGVNKFRQEYVNIVEGDLRSGYWFNYIIKYLIPIEGILLILWWLFQSIGWNPGGWYNPFQADSLGTCIAQWMLVVALLLALNGIIVRRLKKEEQ
ncbi:MAG: sodium-dependent transporter [Calditrichaeota bacterium]|nr:sodium-dependent transporter [Calditrichota bacterium]RQW03870.1 MAG: sodium-dependent transporter [Calditrichota bacterium]